MKRSLTLLAFLTLLLCFILVFSSCDQSTDTSSNTDTVSDTETDGDGKHTHTEEIIPAVPASCTETGLTEGKKCSECNEILVAQTKVDALGHSFDSNFSCSVCGYVDETKYSVGLSFELDEATNTYTVAGRGDCTDTEIIIPPFYKGLPVAAIGDSAFEYNARITSVVLPNSVSKINGSAFSDCENLTSITLGNGILSIGQYAFSDCSKLTSVNYTGSLAEWCKISFTDTLSNPLKEANDLYINGEKISELVIPDEITEIKPYSFMGGSFTSVNIHGNVKAIRNHAFSRASISSVTIGNGVKTIEHSAFSFCTNLTDVTIPASVTEIGINPFGPCSKLTDIIVSEENDCFKSIDGVLYSKNGDTLIQYPAGKPDTEYTIPDGVVAIKELAFHTCKNLTKISVPNSVTELGDSAFLLCTSLKYNDYSNAYYLGNDENPYIILIKAKTTSLPSCAINENTKHIYTGAFAVCESIFDFDIPSGVLSIGSSAFSGCYMLQSIKLPESVRYIGDSAFSGCYGLTSVEIPASVISIGSGAFTNCIRLKSLTFADTSNWFCINIEDPTSEGTPIDVTNPESNAQNQISPPYSYSRDYYWCKK